MSSTSPSPTPAPRPADYEQIRRDEMREEYDCGLDRVGPEWESDDDFQASAAYRDALLFAAGFGGGLGLEA